MKYDNQSSREEIRRIHKRMDLALSEIGRVVGEDLVGLEGAALLARISEKLDQLPPDGREALKIRAAQLASELQLLKEEMQKHLASIEAEIGQSREYGEATQAYGKSQKL